MAGFRKAGPSMADTAWTKTLRRSARRGGYLPAGAVVRLFLPLLVLLAGCDRCEEAVQSRYESMVGNARALVLNSDIALASDDRVRIQSDRPQIATYPMAGLCGEYGQYFLTWRLADDAVVVHGIGTMADLEGATVRRVPITDPSY